MDDIVQRMRAEEADLLRKLEAVRLFLGAYGETPKTTLQPAWTSTSKQTVKNGPKSTRPSLASRADKFGTYGQAMVDLSIALLPNPDDGPMLTRDLLAKFEAQGVEVRGQNKVNALSALLARSTKIAGHGRAGWTRAEARTADEDNEILVRRDQKEIEALNGNTASASVVSEQGAQTPNSEAWANYHSGVRS